MATRLGIIAGTGDLPVDLARRMVASGRGVHVLRIDGFVEPRLAEYEGEIVGIGEISRQIKSLKAAGCKEIVFAGVVKRPDFSRIKLDMRGTLLLPKVISAARNGDDALLRVLVETFEKEGFRVIGVHEAVGDLKAQTGLMAGPEPSDADLSDLTKAARIAALMGDADIGQGCIVCDGLVLAVEAQEGTDAMLKRCAGLPEEIRGHAAARRGVLVKRPKPMQDRRIDLPTSGVSTVENAAAAGLSGIGLEAGGALMVDREAMIEAANRLGVFLYGFAPELGRQA